MRKLFIFGLSPLAKLAHYFATQEMGLEVNGFVVDAEFQTQDVFLSLPVISFDKFIRECNPEDTNIFVAIGYKNMRERKKIYERVKNAGFSCLNIISRKSKLAEKLVIGDNNIFMPGVVVEPEAEIGSNNVFWSNSTICHETKIGNHNFFASNVTVGGEVGIGDLCFFGFSSTVLQHIKIEDEVLIGAGALVLNNAENLTKYYGSPAKNISRIDKQTGICID